MSGTADSNERRGRAPKARAKAKRASADQLGRAFLSDPDTFASLVNGYFFDGREVVRPEDVGDADASEIVLPYGKEGMAFAVSRWRDVLKTTRLGQGGDAPRVVIAVIGCENQTYIDYAMPVRNGLYDLMEMAGEVDRIGALHRRESAEERRAAGGPAPATSSWAASGRPTASTRA